MLIMLCQMTWRLRDSEPLNWGCMLTVNVQFFHLGSLCSRLSYFQSILLKVYQDLFQTKNIPLKGYKPLHKTQPKVLDVSL